MDPTRDPDINPQLFKDQSARFFETYSVPPFTTWQEAAAFIDAGDAMVDAVMQVMQEQDLGYTEETVLIFGSPLAEAFRMTFEGEWRYSPSQDRWVIACTLRDGSVAELNVFNKLEKRLANGMEDSFTYYLQGVNTMLG